MNPTPIITWFEIPTLDYNRGVAFYEAVFKVTLQQEEMEGMAMGVFPHSDAQTSGAIVYCEQSKPQSDGVVIYLYTTDFDATLKRIEANGGKVVMPKTAIPQGFIALFIDSEGNRVGLHTNL